MAIRKQFLEGVASRHGSMAWVIYMALVAAPVMFVAVAWAVIAPAPGALTPPTGPQPLTPLFLPVLGILALLTALAGIIVRRSATPERLARSGIKTQAIPGIPPPDSEEERQLAGAVARYQMALILSLALTETTAIFGFILSFLAQDLTYVLGFSALALGIDLLFLRPNPGIYDRLARAVRA